MLLNNTANLACAVEGYSICTNKNYKGSDFYLCKEILNGEKPLQKGNFPPLQTQLIVRDLYDLFSSNWHDNKTFDKNKTEMTFLFIEKFGNGYNPQTGRFFDDYYNNLFKLVQNTDNKSFDVFKDFLLRKDTNMQNLPTILCFKKLNKYLKTNKNDFETILYLINDKKLPDKLLTSQTPDKIYTLMMQEFVNDDKIHEMGKKYSRMYFDYAIYPKLKSKNALSENNINTFNYLADLYKLNNFEEDYLTRIIKYAPEIDTEKIIRIIRNVNNNDYYTDVALNHIIKTDNIDYLLSQYETKKINEYAKTRLEYDDMFILKEAEYSYFLNHQMEKTKLISMLKPILANPYIKDKYAFAKAEIDKTHKKAEYKKEIINCFKSTDEHMSNILAPNANNMAVFVGLLNPINLAVTVALSPVILLFWPLKSLK